MSKRFKMQKWTGLLSVAALLGFSSLQAGAACTYSLTPAGRTHGYTATNNTFGVGTTLGCAWAVSTTNGWITILSPANSTGSGQVSYAVTTNHSLSSRTGFVMVANQAFTVRQSGIDCDYSISPTNRPHGHGATNNTVIVMTDDLCMWTAISASAWLTITSGASGTGDGVVSYTVDANPNFEDRTGTMTIAGQVFTVTQSGMPCMFSITPATRMHGFGMISNSVSLTATPGCAWTTYPSNSWITTIPRSGIGSSNISYFLDANPTTNERVGMVLIADKLLTLIQDPAPGGPCIYELSPTNRMHGPGAASNYVRVMVPAGCNWTVSNPTAWITIVPYSGVGSGDVGYLVDPNPSTMWRTGIVTIANQVFTVPQDGTPCTAAIVPKSRSHGYGASSNYVRVPVGAECAWTVVNTNTWLTIVTGYSGMGFGDVGYTVDANPATNARSGVVTIDNQSFMVTQAAYSNSCSFALQPSGRTHGYGPTTNSVSVTAGPTCAWTVQNTNSWIAIQSGTSGFGNGTVAYTVEGNIYAGGRTGLVMIANQLFTLSQRGTTNTIAFETIITVAPGLVRVSLTGERGAVWELQGSADLQLWEKISNITNTTGMVEYTDIVPGVSNRRFYRTVLP